MSPSAGPCGRTGEDVRLPGRADAVLGCRVGTLRARAGGGGRRDLRVSPAVSFSACAPTAGSSPAGRRPPGRRAPVPTSTGALRDDAHRLPGRVGAGLGRRVGTLRARAGGGGRRDLREEPGRVPGADEGGGDALRDRPGHGGGLDGAEEAWPRPPAPMSELVGAIRVRRGPGRRDPARTGWAVARTGRSGAGSTPRPFGLSRRRGRWAGRCRGRWTGRWGGRRGRSRARARRRGRRCGVGRARCGCRRRGRGRGRAVARGGRGRRWRWARRVGQGWGSRWPRPGRGKERSQPRSRTRDLCELADSPATRKPPVTRPAYHRPAARDIHVNPHSTSCTCSPGAGAR